jgi:hypothetical protein
MPQLYPQDRLARLPACHGRQRTGSLPPSPLGYRNGSHKPVGKSGRPRTPRAGLRRAQRVHLHRAQHGTGDVIGCVYIYPPRGGSRAAPARVNSMRPSVPGCARTVRSSTQCITTRSAHDWNATGRSARSSTRHESDLVPPPVGLTGHNLARGGEASPRMRRMAAWVGPARCGRELQRGASMSVGKPEVDFPGGEPPAQLEITDIWPGDGGR